MTIHQAYVGCDVSKHHLDFYDASTRKGWRIDNTDTAVAKAVPSLAEGRRFVILEATGFYDRCLRHGLAEAGIAFARINPTMARRFAQACGQRAKTDALDARLLADLGHKLQPEADPPIDADRERLAALVRRRDQLVAMRAAEKGRLKDLADDAVADCIAETVGFLSKQIDILERRIDTMIADGNSLADDNRILSSAPGVGPVTATTLLALMPELGKTSPKRIAALAGLAPYNHDSGMLKGQRCIAGGRRRVRKALYMAAIAAIRSCKRLNDFYSRIADRAPAKKIAIIAVARKLLTCLNAMIRDRKLYAQ